MENSLFLQSAQLVSTSHVILKKLNLYNLLSQIGEVKIVGSMQYGLMTWRDIDLDVVTEEQPDFKAINSLLKKLFADSNIKQIMLINNLVTLEKNRPRSIYVGLKYQDKAQNLWKIDIRILEASYVNTDEVEKMIRENMDAEKKLKILEIKSKVCDHPLYHKSFNSVDIYEAVLLNEVKTFDEFKKYLKSKGNNVKI